VGRAFSGRGRVTELDAKVLTEEVFSEDAATESIVVVTNFVTGEETGTVDTEAESWAKAIFMSQGKDLVLPLLPDITGPATTVEASAMDMRSEAIFFMMVGVVWVELELEDIPEESVGNIKARVAIMRFPRLLPRSARGPFLVRAGFGKEACSRK